MRRYLRHLGVEFTTGAELMHRVRMAANFYDAIMVAKMREGKLSPPRFRLLLCLFGHEAEGETWLNPTRLSKELGLSKNTVSAHLRALEKWGLVERQVDPDDLRQFQICLADAGRDHIRQAAPEHLRLLDELAQALPPHEIEQLLTLLDKLIVSLELYGARQADESENKKPENKR